MSLKNSLDAGEFAVLTEMEPPKGCDISAMIESAEQIKDQVEAFVISEMNNAMMRMSALAGAMLLQTKGMETAMQICGRDRNRLALQADLLGAGACGIPTVIVTDGDDPLMGDHHQTPAVQDIGTSDLLRLIGTLRKGSDMSGAELKGAPEFRVGASLKISSDGEEPDARLAEMEKKIAAGAEFFITQPVFDLNLLTPFREQAGDRAKLIPNILLLKSLGMARYMERNVPHIHIPKDLIRRLQKAKDKEGECMQVAAELVAGLKQSGYAGVLLSLGGAEHKISPILSGG
ncbi:MAG: methylenetetrahydrofolate reductase [Desulfobacterales bacterium]